MSNPQQRVHRTPAWPSLSRLVTRAMLVLLAMAIAAWLLFAMSAPRSAVTGRGSGHWLAVRAAEPPAELLMQGVVEGAVRADLLAPFEGGVLAVHAALGDEVEQGAPLLDLDTSAVDAQVREARAQSIKSEQALAEARGWKHSAAYRAAQRQAAGDEGTLRDAEQRLADTRQLHAKGIVSRDELDQARQSAVAARASRESSHDALAQLADKGNAAAIRLAELEHANHAAKLAQLEAKAAASKVRAPLAGVITMLGPRDGELSPQSLAPGARVTEGSLIVRVVDTARIQISGTVAESAVEQIRPGQRAVIKPANQPGAVLHGRVVRVSSLPLDRPGDGGDERRAARFRVVVEADAQEHGARLPRLGTNADVAIAVGETPEGVLVDLRAVQAAGDGEAVLQLRRGGKALAPMKVRVGPTTHDGVYVIDGSVKADDEVWVPAHAATGADATGDEPQAGQDADAAATEGLRGRLRRLFGGAADPSP